MRYSKIDITGTPLTLYSYYREDIYLSENLTQFGSPIATSEDGLLFYITVWYYRFILIPESHPLFNICLLYFTDHTVFTDKKRHELDAMLKRKYWEPLYLSADKEWRKKVKMMKV